jgi:CMD domain protein
MDDVIDTGAGLAPGSPLADLRRQRPDVVREAQESYEAIFEPAYDTSIGRAERAALGLRIALLNEAQELAEHYRVRLDSIDAGGRLAATVASGAPAPADARLAAVLAHVDLVTRAPGTATPDDLAKLATAGLSPRDIVALSQLIALVNYQVRVAAGLRLLGASA